MWPDVIVGILAYLVGLSFPFIGVIPETNPLTCGYGTR